MTRNLKKFLGIILFLLVSCSLQPKGTVTLPPETTKPVSGQTVTVTIQPVEKQEPMAASTTITPTATEEALDPEVQPSKDLLQAPCLPVNEHFSPDQVVAQDLFVTHRNTAFIYNLNANSQTELQPRPHIAERDYFISPDGKWAAYTNYSTEKYILSILSINSLRKNQSEPDYRWTHSEPFEVQGWFTQDTLLLTRRSVIRSDTIADVSTVILNPFTQKEHEFNLLNYPNYKTFKYGGVGNYIFRSSNLLPDPTLTQLIYPEASNDLYDFTLWDLTQQQAVLKTDFYFENPSNDPLWSQDGKDLITMGAKIYEGVEWFQVTREGNVRQITHFGKVLPGSFYLEGSRSWDGRYLVFDWEYSKGEAPENRQAKYFILDLKAPTLEGFCIDATPFSGGELQPPVWSSDNRYVAISNTSYNAGDLILLDVEKRQAYHVGKDVIARGWVARP